MWWCGGLAQIDLSGQNAELHLIQRSVESEATDRPTGADARVDSQSFSVFSKSQSITPCPIIAIFYFRNVREIVQGKQLYFEKCTATLRIRDIIKNDVLPLNHRRGTLGWK